MASQSTQFALKQRQLRKIVKSLTKVSNKDTSQIRNDIAKAANSKNRDRIKYHLQNDLLLKSSKQGSLPHVLFTHRLFEDRGNRVASLKEKKIQSEACLRRVNFQYRKLQLKKQQIAKKQHSSMPHSPLPAPLHSSDIANLRISQAFEKVVIGDEEEWQSEGMLKRARMRLDERKSRVKTLYDEHCSSVKALAQPSEKQLLNPQIRLSMSKEEHSQNNQLEQSHLQFTKTHSIIILSQSTNSRKRQSLIDLIEMSRLRATRRQEPPEERLTRKELIEQKATNTLINSLKDDIDRENKLRESIVFGGLKKLLYGDRRGRFIQDNTFKTRLQGENSPAYLNILKHQEKILESFGGSIINRRNMAEKFSNILGTINKHDKNVHEQAFPY